MEPTRPTDEIVRAAGDALGEVGGYNDTWAACDQNAAAVVAAIRPLIEAAVAERIADRIVSLTFGSEINEPNDYRDGHRRGRQYAANIARTYPEWSKE